MFDFDTYNLKNFERRLNGVKEDYQDLLMANRNLVIENAKLKSDAYKDEEMSRLNTELREFKSSYYRGFPISKSEGDSITTFLEKHRGHSYSYVFVPTEFGTSGTVRCSCGCEFEFQKIK